MELMCGGIAGMVGQYCSVKLCYRSQNINVQGSAGKATAARGDTPGFLGTVARMS